MTKTCHSSKFYTEELKKEFDKLEIMYRAYRHFNSEEKASKYLAKEFDKITK